jgi:sortase B
MMKMKNKKKRKHIIAWLILAISICAISINGHKLWETHRFYQIGEENYKELIEQIRPVTPSNKPDRNPEIITGINAPDAENLDVDTPNIKIPFVDIPDIAVDFGVLQTINSDAVAWLCSPNTVIDYPVMKAKDYNEYLRHLPDGTYNVNGSLFIDYNNAPDFTDQLTVIYGHHMKTGQMFGSLKGYKGQAYFKEHPYMYLYTDQRDYQIDLIYGCVIGTNEWREKAFMYEDNLDSLMAYASYNTTFTSEVQYTPGDRIVAMSTCSYEFDGARYILLGVLRPEYE